MNISDVNNDGIALDGFDPVAHYAGTPLRGDKQFSFSIGDATYHFSSIENLQAFQKDPAQYIPVAGSYTASPNVKPPQVDQKDGENYIGNKTLEYRRNLEDSIQSNENNVPIDIKEDGDVEMQNLSDASK